MSSKLAAQRISNALRVGTLAGLLTVMAGCNSPAVQPTAVNPTSTVPPITAPTIVPTEAPTLEAASPTLAPAETPTSVVSAPTAPAGETAVPVAASSTPAPTVAVGDLQWKQIALAGNDITDLSFIAQGANVSVLAAGPKGVWTRLTITRHGINIMS